MDKTGIIYISIPFNSHITRKNNLKNMQSTQNSKKNPLKPSLFEVLIIGLNRRDLHVCIALDSHITHENWPINEQAI